MEITLEKIELVKDRTGVSYKEAKEALEAAEGNVVDAIIAIEESINAKIGSKVSDQSDKIVQKIKEYVKKGNISKITVKKDDDTVINLPVTVGIIGTVLAPWVTAIGAIVAVGTKCRIELVKDDGEIIDITEKYEDTVEDVKDKSGEAINKAKDVKDKVVSNYSDIKDIVKDAATDIKHTMAKDADAPKDVVGEVVDEVEDFAGDVQDKVEDFADAAKDKVEDIVEDAKDAFKE